MAAPPSLPRMQTRKQTSPKNLAEKPYETTPTPRKKGKQRRRRPSGALHRRTRRKTGASKRSSLPARSSCTRKGAILPPGCKLKNQSCRRNYVRLQWKWSSSLIAVCIVNDNIMYTSPQATGSDRGTGGPFFRPGLVPTDADKDGNSASDSSFVIFGGVGNRRCSCC